MQPITWYEALFVSVPQSLIIILLGFALFNLKIDYIKSIFVALIMGIVCYCLRLVSVPLAINTISIIFSIAILTCLICKTGFIDSLLAASLGVMLYGVIENLFLQIFFMVTNYTIADVLTNSLLNIILFIPVSLIIIVIYLLCRKFNIIVYDLGVK